MPGEVLGMSSGCALNLGKNYSYQLGKFYLEVFRSILRHPSCHFGRNKFATKVLIHGTKRTFSLAWSLKHSIHLPDLEMSADKLDRNISPGRFYKHLQGDRVVKYPQFLHTFWMRSSRISKSFCLAKVLDKFCKLSTWQENGKSRTSKGRFR